MNTEQARAGQEPAMTTGDLVSDAQVSILHSGQKEETLTGFEISSVSYAYPNVAADDRAALARSLGSVDKALARVVEVGIPVFALSTCLRVEIATAGPPDQLDDALRILFGEIPTVRGGFRRQGSDAVEHLFRIVAGLESPVVGEREILVQFRQAAAAAADIGATNGTFRGLFDAAIASARCIRGELPNPQESMASIAAGLTEPANHVAVLGHGAMGKCIIEALLALPHRPIVEVFARRPEAIDTKGVIARSLAEAPEALVTLPAVISVTSAKTRLIPADQLAALLSTRTDPLTMIDMAMPPDFSPPSGAAVRYFDIDDLADLARDRTPTEQADRMVAESAAAFMHKMWAGKRTGAVIENLFGQADDAVNEVVERFAKKLSSPEDRAILEQTAHTAVRKLLHRPVRYLSGDGVGDATTVAAAFGIGLDD